MAHDFGGDTTGFTNEHFTSFPPQSSFERDRLRLQRELDRDLDHPSFSSSSISGLENAGRPFNYDDDNTNTFDIDNDAQATSTRNVNFNASMLQTSPAINSRVLAAEFADFSMAGNDYTEESIEVGRNREKNLSSQDYARAPFSKRGVTRTASKRLSEAYAAAGREMASPIPKQSRQNSIRSDTSEVILPLNKNVLPMSTKNKDQQHRLMEEDTFDLSKPLAKKGSQNARQTSESSNGTKPKKTTEQVSSRAQRTAGSAYRATRVEDDASSLASFDDIVPVPSTTRKVSRPVVGSALGARGPSLRAAMKAAEAKDAANARRKSSTTTAPTAATTAVTQIPKSFKSTAAFIRELGLDGQSLNAMQDPPTYDETVDFTNQNNTNTNEQSFLLPNLAGISELINTEATRIYNNTASARKRNPHGQPPSHKPIESIPVPQDNRAILMAMQLLQDKMSALEEQKSVTEKRCEELKEQLKRIRQKYEKEYQRARVAEEQLALAKRSGPGTVYTNADADTELLREKAEDKERSKIAFMVEKMKLENNITSYKTQMDEISHKFEITKIALKAMQDERNSAVNSAAAAIASQRHLQQENERLLDELDAMRADKLEIEDRISAERQAWQAKEQILRKRVDKAREAEGVAREAINGLQRKLNLVGKSGGNGNEYDQDVAELVRKELEKLNPGLLVQPVAPPTFSKASLKKALEPTFTTHSAPATVTITAPPQKEATANKYSKPSLKKTTQQVTIGQVTQGVSYDNTNETAYTVDGDYIRRIADEIDEERRRRKEAEKLAAATSAEMEKIRQIVGTKATTTSGVKRKSTATSGREDTVTFHSQKMPPRPLSAPPTSVIYTSEAENAGQRVTQAPHGAANPRKRRIKKVVYYEDGDTAEFVSKERAGNTEQRQPAKIASAPSQNPQVAGPSSSGKTGSPQDFDMTFYTARKESSSNSRQQTTSTGEFDFDKQEGGKLPPPPVIPDHIRSVIDVDAEHDALTCTVCIRREMQDLQEESRMLARTHGVETAELAKAGYDELSTLRPSKSAEKQLNKVVRGLQDEFVHLKMAYQEKAEEFLSLDPTKGKRRRKEITREINDMVTEMDWKCDMIYALYDVAEEVITSRPDTDGKYTSSSSAAKGKGPAKTANTNMNGLRSDEESEFEYAIPARRNGRLVEVEDVDESGEYHHHMADLSNVNMGRGGGDNEVSLLDETEDEEDVDDTNREVARHLARQGKEVDRGLVGNGRGGQEKVVMDSYEDRDEMV